ncbi:hypothetical protein KBB17_00585 [Candidatus Saccharibacteria bacterium]|nr:hypothetical protein [Candidatus Saccharibacteria bacterium]
MIHLRNLFVATLVGLVLTGLTFNLSSSKLPPCGLVEKGIGISTYGCSDTRSSDSECGDEVPNSKEMTGCVQNNYYAQKTFPFGFKQYFGDDANMRDTKPLKYNRTATFVSSFTATLVIIYINKNRKNKIPKSSK